MLFAAARVFAGAGVNLDLVALLDEQRIVYLRLSVLRHGFRVRVPVKSITANVRFATRSRALVIIHRPASYGGRHDSITLSSAEPSGENKA